MTDYQPLKHKADCEFHHDGSGCTCDANPKDLAGRSKPQLHLIPPSALLYEAKVMELGAAKYGPYNWREKKVTATAYISAAMRHLMSLLDGEDIDAESNQSHAAHVRSCMGIFLDALATGNLIDDRPTKGAAGRLIKEMSK